MPFHSYRRPPTSAPVQRASRPRFASRHRAAPELPAPVVMLGAVAYRDHDGIWWTVREERANRVAGDACLVFASAGQLIRVPHYPAGWRALSTAGLVALAGTR